jgi:hypothetical protein
MSVVLRAVGLAFQAAVGMGNGSEGKHPRNGIRVGAIRPARARQASSMLHHVCGAEGGWFGLSGRG